MRRFPDKLVVTLPSLFASPVMDGRRLRLLLLDHASCHKVVANSTEEREAGKLVEVVKDYMLLRAKKFVADCDGRAVLFSYGSDGTPLLTRANFTHVLDGKRVVRNAGKAEEFLIERAFLRSTDESGAPVMVSLGRDPALLGDGKSAWHMFTALTRFFPLVQAIGHTGIVVTHYVFDRAIWSALTRLARQRHALYHKVCADQGSESEGAHRELLDWCVTTACANHDCQNALKWALKGAAGESPEAVLKALHVSIASVRNGLDLLHGSLPAFVSGSLHFVPARIDAQEPLFNFWVTLGLEPSIAELCADLQILWNNDKLEVSDVHREDTGLFEKICHIMMPACRFRSFTDSRWLTVGDSCRSLVGCLSLGLSRWVQITRDDPKNSDYYLHGFGFLDAASKRYAVIAAMISPVCDSLLLELFEDDRVAQRVEILEGALGSEIEWLSSVHPLIWERMCAVFDNSGPCALRTQCLVAASSIAAFCKMRFLGMAREYPWKLLQGDISANIDVLMLDEEVSGPTAVKIRTLALGQFNRRALVQGVQRLGDASWTTNVQEQGHASGAVLHKIHTRYGAKMLSGRAFIHMIRPLFQHHSQDKGMARLEQAQAALRRKAPDKITGRHVFFFCRARADRDEARRWPGSFQTDEDDADETAFWLVSDAARGRQAHV